MGFNKFKTAEVTAYLQQMYSCLNQLEHYSQVLGNATRVYQASMEDDVSRRALALIAEYDSYIKKMREICKRRLSSLETALGYSNHIEGNMASRLGS